MRVLLDANILFPTVLREILIGVARGGAFTPLWSPRIQDEWIHAARRFGEEVETIARAEIALLNHRWPDALIDGGAVKDSDLSLPDPDDRHVLAAAINGRAHTLLTRNLKDFPNRVLSAHNIVRRDPDGFLLEIAYENPPLMHKVLAGVKSRTETASGRDQPLRALLKRAGLPRLGKANAATV